MITARILRLALAATAMLLVSCASLQPSTVAELSRLNERELAALDGSVLRMRISFLDQYLLSTAESRLTLQFVSGGQIHRGVLQFEVESLEPRAFASGLPSPKQPDRAYALKLTPASVDTLKSLQVAIRPGDTNDVNSTSELHSNLHPPGARSTKV